MDRRLYRGEKGRGLELSAHGLCSVAKDGVTVGSELVTLRPYKSARPRTLDEPSTHVTSKRPKFQQPEPNSTFEVPMGPLPSTSIHATPFRLPSRVKLSSATKEDTVPSPISNLQWHPLESGVFLSSSFDRTVRLWHVCKDQKNRDSLAEKRRWNLEGSVNGVTWLPTQPTRFACAGFNQLVSVYDTASSEEAAIFQFKHPEPVTSLISHPSDGNLLFSGAKNALYLWDCRISCERGAVQIYQDKVSYDVQSLALLPSGQELACSTNFVGRESAQRSILVWDVRKPVILSDQIYYEHFVCGHLATHPALPYFAAQSNGGYVMLISSQKPYKVNRRRRFEGHTVSGYKINFCFSPDGSKLLSGSADGRLFLYDFKSGNCLKTIEIGQSPVTCVNSSVVDNAVVTGCYNGEIKMVA